MSLTGATIALIDFHMPLRARLAQRKHTSGYRWTVPAVTDRREGRGFYFGRDEQMDRAASTLRLRVEATGDAFTYGDSDPVSAYVVALPHGRGFLPACGEGAGMWGSLDYRLYDTSEEAARDARSMASEAAERMADDDAAFRAECDAEDAAAAEAECDGTND